MQKLIYEVSETVQWPDYKMWISSRFEASDTGSAVAECYKIAN